MKIRLRQVALVARDLAGAEQDIREGLGLELCYRDPGVALFGLTNALFPVGDKLLEVVSPHEDGTTAGRLLDKRGGDGGYMVILQVDDLDEMRSRFAAAEARVVFEAVIDGITGLHLHPRDVGGAILSTDQADDWDQWPWAGPTWREHIRTGVVSDITAVDIQARNPASMAERWAQVLGCKSIDNTIALNEGQIRFVDIADGRGEGVAAIELRGSAGDSCELELVGCRIRIVDT
jgi:hypothetical protein